MASRRKWAITSSIALAASLAGCGGGGGRVNSTPVPPPPSQPVASAEVDIFQAPASQEFAAVSGGPGELRIRYDAAKKQYQVMAPGRDWDVLADDPLSSPGPGFPNQSFVFASASGPNMSYFATRVSYGYADPAIQYHYSNLAAWGLRTAGPGNGTWTRGYTAFGMATPPGGVPVTGSGNYEGRIEGQSTIDVQWDDVTFPATVGGSVALRFDFGRGTLEGEIKPHIHGDTLIELGTIAFTDTAYSTGSRTFSGRFATSASGSNSFSGLFTGPDAQELIGRWTLPFAYPADGSVQSASGAWIAKRN